TAAVKTTTPRKRSSATAKSTQTTTRTRAAASKKPSAGKATTAKSKPARSRAASKPADAADPAPEIIVKKSPSGKTRRVRTTPRTAKVTTRKPPARSSKPKDASQPSLFDEPKN
ncbi:MAG: hypothetical protein KDI03_11730, partial [Anaerolineae bacterium]|nr:hypothetical protein [Anaerolineae bacterium]